MVAVGLRVEREGWGECVDSSVTHTAKSRIEFEAVARLS